MVWMKGTSLFFAPFAPFNPEAVPEAERLPTLKGTTKLVHRFSSCSLLSWSNAWSQTIGDSEGASYLFSEFPLFPPLSWSHDWSQTTGGSIGGKLFYSDFPYLPLHPVALPEDKRLAIARGASYFLQIFLFGPLRPEAMTEAERSATLKRTSNLNSFFVLFCLKQFLELSGWRFWIEQVYISLFFSILKPFPKTIGLWHRREQVLCRLFVLFYPGTCRKPEQLAMSKRESILPTLFALFIPKRLPAPTKWLLWREHVSSPIIHSPLLPNHDRCRKIGRIKERARVTLILARSL